MAAAQCTLPGFALKWASGPTAEHMSGRVATIAYISDPKIFLFVFPCVSSHSSDFSSGYYAFNNINPGFICVATDLQSCIPYFKSSVGCVVVATGKCYA